jgi:hypothetical protein
VKWSRARTADKEANATTAGAAVFARTTEEKANAKTAVAAVFARTANGGAIARIAIASPVRALPKLQRQAQLQEFGRILCGGRL